MKVTSLLRNKIIRLSSIEVKCRFPEEVWSLGKVLVMRLLPFTRVSEAKIIINYHYCPNSLPNPPKKRFYFNATQTHLYNGTTLLNSQPTWSRRAEALKVTDGKHFLWYQTVSGQKALASGQNLSFYFPMALEQTTTITTAYEQFVMFSEAACHVSNSHKLSSPKTIRTWSLAVL